ncbi:MAG: P-loop NTPase fold protein [Anaerofustis sp.]
MDYSDRKFDDVNDKLGRKQFAVNLMNIVNQWNVTEHESDSLVFSIDASWGAGKSCFLHMWKNMLLSNEYEDKNYAVAFYNAWENDDSENAFIPLLYALKEIDSQSQKEELKGKAAAFLKTCGIALLKDGIKKLIGTEISEIVSKLIDAGGEGLKESLNKKSESFFNEYDGYVKMKQEFKTSLEELIPEGGKLIIFVDELDRCRPTFAVETLEIVKHFFDSENVVFIFAVDLEQLSHSIATMYGAGMDSAGYLRRFFDVNMNIPQTGRMGYIEYKVERTLNIFNSELYQQEFSKRISNILIGLQCSLRDIDKIMDSFYIFVLYYKKYIDEANEYLINGEFEIPVYGRNADLDNQYLGSPKKSKILDTFELYLYFIALKYKSPEIYNLLLNKSYWLERDNGSIKEIFLGKDYSFLSPICQTLIVEFRHAERSGKVIQDQTKASAIPLFDTYKEGESISDHIEKTIEMFT